MTVVSVFPRLDRLSALLEGLSPKVWLVQGDLASDAEITRSRPSLMLHVLSEDLHEGVASALSLLICQAEQSAALAEKARSGCARLMTFRAVFDGPAGPLILTEFRQPEQIFLNEADPSLNRIVQLIASEVLEPRCGQPALMNRAGDILLIGLLRHMVSHPTSTSGLSPVSPTRGLRGLWWRYMPIRRAPGRSICWRSRPVCREPRSPISSNQQWRPRLDNISPTCDSQSPSDWFFKDTA